MSGCEEKDARARVVAEARSWLNTPYRHMARVKGQGADCAMFPLEVYASLGLIIRPEVPYYPLDWHLHRSAERYLDIVRALAREVAAPWGSDITPRTPLPGDFCVVKFGRAFAHGLIVIAWPECMHSHLSHGVVYVNAEQDPQLFNRPMKVFSLWAEERGPGNAPGRPVEGEQAAKPPKDTGEPQALQGRTGGESAPSERPV